MQISSVPAHNGLSVWRREGGGETGEKEEVRGGRGVRKDVSVCPLYHGICHGRPLETVAPQ